MAGARLRQAVIVAVGLALGVGTVLAFGGDEPTRGRAHQGQSVTRFAFTNGPLAPVTVAAAAEGGPGLPEEPATAQSALGIFLQAMTEGRPEVAYTVLDAPSRRRFPTPASWSRAQADLLRPTSFEIGASRAGFGSTGDVVEIEVTATHLPSIDPVRGLVPGRSQALWTVHQEANGWRVAAQPASVRPILPADVGASEAVREWLARLEACDGSGAASLQVDSYLYGPTEFVRAPCARSGNWTVGPAVELDKAPDPKDFLAAFGPSVGGWIRLVPIDGPGRRFFAATAPIGEAWQIVGVAIRD